jgi:hypothetical protein
VIEAIAALVVVVVGQRALALVLASSRAAALCKQYRSADGAAARDAFKKLASMKEQHALYLVARWGLADDDLAIQELANVRLLEAGLNALVPLCKALDDQEFEARSDAYEFLGGMGRAAIPYLRAACSGGEKDRTARKAACAALTQTSDGADGSI